MFIPEIKSFAIKVENNYTARLSVITRTMQPVPATSVSYTNEISDMNEHPSVTFELTFSCQPNNTLPLTSPHPGMAIPLYRYFIRVSCASWSNDFTMLGISVALVLPRMVRRVCKFRFCSLKVSARSNSSVICMNALLLHQHLDHKVHL